MSKTYFVDKHFALRQLLLKLHSPGHLVEADKGGVVEGVRVKLHRGLGGGRRLCPLEKSDLVKQSCIMRPSVIIILITFPMLGTVG